MSPALPRGLTAFQGHKKSLASSQSVFVDHRRPQRLKVDTTTPRLGPHAHRNRSLELWCKANEALSQIPQTSKIRSLKPMSTHASKCHLLPEVPEALFQRAQQLHGKPGVGGEIFPLNMTRYRFTDLILQTQFTGFSFPVPLLTSGSKNLWKRSQEVYKALTQTHVRCKHVLSARQWVSSYHVKFSLILGKLYFT